MCVCVRLFVCVMYADYVVETNTIRGYVMHTDSLQLLLEMVLVPGARS